MKKISELDKESKKTIKKALSLWLRYLKDNNLFEKFMKLTTKERLLNALADSLDWGYDYPYPIQHSASMFSSKDCYEWFQEHDYRFKSYCRRKNLHNYRYEFEKIYKKFFDY